MSAEDLAAMADDLPAALKQFAETEVIGELVDESTKAAPEAAVEEKPADPLLEKAGKIGWVDKDAWVAAGKDADEWVDHAEYVRRKPLFDKIHSLNKALKDKDEKIDAVSKYAQKAAEIARDKAIKEFEEQRRKAVEVGDVEAFEEADKQLEEVRKEPLRPAAEDKPAEPEIPPVIQQFAKRNETWFEKDKAMTMYMVETTKEYTASGMTLEKAMEQAEADTKKEFAHKLENPNKAKPAAVSANNAEVRPKAPTYASLKEEHKQVWSVLKKNMTFDKFIEGLKAQGEYQ